MSNKQDSIDEKIIKNPSRGCEKVLCRHCKRNRLFRVGCSKTSKEFDTKWNYNEVYHCNTEC